MPVSIVKKHSVGLLLPLLLVFSREALAQPSDLDTQLMLTTVKVSDTDSSGTAFILSRPKPGDPKATQFLLITAEHTLSRSRANEVTVVFRKKSADGGHEKAPVKITVRQDGKVLWKKHPTADVGILPITPPPDALVPSVSVNLLASDEDLERHQIHPGDPVRCVGFPHPNQFEPNEAGFGVVRSGCIAGYPLRPTRKTKTLLLDLNTFEGDSGAPVYLVDDHRLVAGKTEPGQVRLILGLMVGQHFLDEEFKMIYQTGKFRHRMGF
ncbi:MAG: trypsin-like peptidase domain-containing protein, partial [Isosphaeraceae bacterium]